MKRLTIKYEKTNSSTVFFNKESVPESIECAFNEEKRCSPNCAACEIFSAMPEKAYCLRGNFVIGSL